MRDGSFNSARPHQGIGAQIPTPSVVSLPPIYERQRVLSLPILGGLPHDYHGAA
jgi:hypothetical protein